MSEIVTDCADVAPDIAHVIHETSHGGYSREVAVLVEPERLQDESDDRHDGLDQAELQRRL